MREKDKKISDYTKEELRAVMLKSVRKRNLIYYLVTPLLVVALFGILHLIFSLSAKVLSNSENAEMVLVMILYIGSWIAYFMATKNCDKLYRLIGFLASIPLTPIGGLLLVGLIDWAMDD